MDEDRREKLKAFAQQKVQSLMAGPKLTALSPGDAKSGSGRPVALGEAQATHAPSKGWSNLSHVRSIVEDVLDGGDIRVTNEASVISLAGASRELGEDVLAELLTRLPGEGCGSLLAYGTSIADGSLAPEPWDLQFLVGRTQIQKRGAGLRVRPEHGVDDVAAILNAHQEVVFTSPGRLAAVLDQAREEKFSTLEQLFADMLAEQALSIAGLLLAVRHPEFSGLRHRSTAEFLVEVATGFDDADELVGGPAFTAAEAKTLLATPALKAV